jgi:predicted outer membrane repeat protein
VSRHLVGRVLRGILAGALLTGGSLVVVGATAGAEPPDVSAPDPAFTPPLPSGSVTAQTVRNATDETSYCDALIDLSLDASGPHTIEIDDDITLTGTNAACAVLGVAAYLGTQDLTINGNGHTIDGGGITQILVVSNPIANPSLTINNLVAHHGFTSLVGPGPGGAMNFISAGVLTINSSEFSDNVSNADGGAIDADGDTIINDSIFSGNEANGDGGAIDSDGIRTTINNSTFSGNSAPGGEGGAIDSADSATISDSTFANNSTGPGGDGGGIDTSNSGSDLLVVRSTFSGNTADGDGGAMEAEDDVNVTNSTITDNTSVLGGGGINAELGDITLNYVTVVFNHDPIASDLSTQDPAGDLSSFASLVGGDGGGDNCVLGGATIASSYNFAEDDSCGFTGTGDRQNTPDPMIGDLADNGGPTQTMLPKTGSPLIDQIPSSSPCAGVVILTDQRGVLRPQGPACDIGAVEVEVVAAVTVTPTFTG